MKKLLTTTLLAMFFCSINAQTPDWEWVKSAGGAGSESGDDVCTDLFGNVYVIGGFSSSMLTFGSTTLTNAGTSGSDIFIVKYDASGKVLWAKSVGGTGSDYSRSIVTDKSGNVYILGDYASPTLVFGATTLSNTGSSDIFIAKYDSSGKILWAKSYGSTDWDQGKSISTDPIGNVYITGNYRTSITFGSITFTNTGMAKTSDLYIVKFDSSGKTLWAKSAASYGDDLSYAISTDAAGNVYVTGSFNAYSITFETTTLNNAGYADIFVAKYNTIGNLVWVKSAGGTSGDIGHGINVDSAGNIYVTGRFQSPTLIFGTTTLTNSGGYDFFIAKYSSSGNAIWAKKANIGTGGSIHIDANNNIFVAGGFGGSSITFGSITLTNSANGYSDIFAVKFDASGNALWAKSAGGTGNDGGSITGDAFGNLYFAGSFSNPTAVFDTFTLISNGSTDMFLGRIGNKKPPTIIITSHPLSQTKCTGNPVTFSVTAIGNNLKYQWKKNGTDINGANADTFIIASVALSDNGTYSCTISDTGYTTSSKGAALNVSNPPAISTQPTAVSKCVGENASFSVTATGTGISYQWRKGGSAITGATGSSYSISNVSNADAGNYDVVITGSCSPSVTSNTVTLTVNPVPTITVQPSGANKKTGESVTFSVIATGGSIAYQWQKNTIDISGATSASYSKSNLVQADSGNYRCIVTNSCGKDTSNTANLKVDKLVSVKDYENDRQFSIYPNPTSGIITIKLTTNNISADLQIFDISGREVIHKQISEPSTPINISHLPQGLYYISLMGQKAVYFEKIVKQ